MRARIAATSAPGRYSAAIGRVFRAGPARAIRIAEHRQSDILDRMTPAELLVSVRRRSGLTQVELARRAGTSQPVVSAYEHGRRDPTFGTLRRLVAAGGGQLRLDARPMPDL